MSNFHHENEIQFVEASLQNEKKNFQVNYKRI